MRKFKNSIYFNSPVILGMSLVSLILLFLNSVTGDAINRLLSVYRTSFLDPMLYVRLLTHILVHQDFSHYTGNFLMILAVGPMVEEKYGSGRLLLMIGVTAVITGIINVLFFPGYRFLGASGILFMLILLASFTQMREGKIPLTVLLVGILYLGNEVVAWITVSDNVSRLSHILGGLCGAGFGYLFQSRNNRRSPY